MKKIKLKQHDKISFLTTRKKMLIFNKKYFEYKKRENYVCDHNIIGNNHFTEKSGKLYEW